MRTSLFLAQSIIALVLCSNPLLAGMISLDVNTLPSAQGWVYSSNNPSLPETTAFSAGGGVLELNTFDAANFDSAVYGLLDVVDPIPYTLSFTARVLSYATSGLVPASWPYAFGFVVNNGDGERVILGISDDSIGANPVGNNPNVFDTSIDNTVFHDYRLEGTPGVGWELFVDDSLVGSGSFIPGVAPDASGIGFGDLTGEARARAQIASLTFTQVPEPITATMLSLMGFGVLGRATRRLQRGTA